MFRNILVALLLFAIFSLIYEAGRLAGFMEASAICDIVSQQL